MDELRTSTRSLYEYRESCLLSFSETWLNQSIPDEEVDMENFHLARSDRTVDSGKSRGGGVCMYINKQWCNDWTIKEKLCTPNIEFMIVGLRPFYLPREFSQLFVMVVYIHPGADVREASQVVANRINRLEAISPDSPKFVIGDFNQCTLGNVLPTFDQYVTQPTRNDATLDRCYGNVPRAYTTKACAQLGASDHNNVLLMPSYKQKLKRNKPAPKVCQCWTEEAIDELRGCYESTDWNLFFESHNKMDQSVDVLSEYIRYCAETITYMPTFENQKSVHYVREAHITSAKSF